MLRERSVRKELSDSPNTSKRYRLCFFRGKQARQASIQYPSSSTFGKKENWVKKKIVKGIVGEAP